MLTRNGWRSVKWKFQLNVQVLQNESILQPSNKELNLAEVASTCFKFQFCWTLLMKIQKSGISRCQNCQKVGKGNPKVHIRSSTFNRKLNFKKIIAERQLTLKWRKISIIKIWLEGPTSWNNWNKYSYIS